MPKIGANFEFISQEPNFQRDSYETLEAMKNTELIDDGHLAFCKEDKKTYKFLSSNEYSDTLGYWRELKGGYEPDGTSIKIDPESQELSVDIIDCGEL